MSTKRVKLTVAQAAALTGVTPATWRSYVARGQRPAPDGKTDPCGCPWWYETTVTRDVAARRAKRQPATV